jgi:hypothetical protein
VTDNLRARRRGNQDLVAVARVARDLTRPSRGHRAPPVAVSTQTGVAGAAARSATTMRKHLRVRCDASLPRSAVPLSRARARWVRTRTTSGEIPSTVAISWAGEFVPRGKLDDLAVRSPGVAQARRSTGASTQSIRAAGDDSLAPSRRRTATNEPTASALPTPSRGVRWSMGFCDESCLSALSETAVDSGNPGGLTPGGGPRERWRRLRQPASRLDGSCS